jgi:hypothetical protein
VRKQNGQSTADLQTATQEVQEMPGRKQMHSIFAKLVMGVAITAIGVFGADNSLGTWKRNVTKSKTSTAIKNPIKSLTLVNQASGGGIKATVTGERQDGTPITSSYFVKYDGKEYPVPGAPWDTISIKQIDADTFTSEAKKTGGKYHAKSQTVISKDGKTMTLTTQGTNTEGKPFTSTLVYDKQ